MRGALSYKTHHAHYIVNLEQIRSQRRPATSPIKTHTHTFLHPKSHLGSWWENPHEAESNTIYGSSPEGCRVRTKLKANPWRQPPGSQTRTCCKSTRCLPVLLVRGVTHTQHQPRGGKAAPTARHPNCIRILPGKAAFGYFSGPPAEPSSASQNIHEQLS